MLCSSFSPAMCFTHGDVCISVLLCPFVPVSPSPTLSTSPFSISTSPFLPCKQVHQYHFSSFHLYALLYDISFSLSDLLHSVWQPLDPSTSLQITQSHSFLWLSNIPLYVCTMGLPNGSVVKQSTCYYSSCRRRGFDPWVGRIPWSRKWHPTPVFLPG